MGKNCVICGKPSGMYPLCKEHLTMKNDGKVVKCEECGTWHIVGEPCKCATKTAEVKPQADVMDDELTCIICGRPSNGKHFCHECWKKYKDKIVYFKVKDCKDFEKLEAEYESEFTCDDGHLVKSPYEKIIDNWLYSEGIRHAYEPKLDIDKDKDITPDFYINEYNGRKDIYIEFWGYDETNIKYQQIKEYKMEVYKKLVKTRSMTVVYLNKKEVETDAYKKRIKYAEQGKINEH